MTTLYRYGVIALGLIFILGGIWYTGYNKGKQTIQSQYLTQQIQQLQAVINHTKTLNKQAQEASVRLEKLINAKAEADIKTTKEFNNALKATKNTRAQCVFDERIMQQLDTARRRAADAAYSAQLDGVLPSARRDER